MTYISTAERLGIEQGRVEGRVVGRVEGTRQLVLRQAEKRFGPLSEPVAAQIVALPIERLDALALALLDFATGTDLVMWLDAPAG